mmetsp:Transcript_11380/g.22900  ORF Transcript_11380/g.22900 Transcript_11380/m.22900 type:complete len:253 (+) Transcript_11380:1351-2109(+)
MLPPRGTWRTSSSWSRWAPASTPPTTTAGRRCIWRARRGTTRSSSSWFSVVLTSIARTGGGAIRSRTPSEGGTPKSSRCCWTRGRESTRRWRAWRRSWRWRRTPPNPSPSAPRPSSGSSNGTRSRWGSCSGRGSRGMCCAPTGVACPSSARSSRTATARPTTWTFKTRSACCRTCGTPTSCSSSAPASTANPRSSSPNSLTAEAWRTRLRSGGWTRARRGAPPRTWCMGGGSSSDAPSASSTTARPPSSTGT